MEQADKEVMPVKGKMIPKWYAVIGLSLIVVLVGVLFVTKERNLYGKATSYHASSGI